MEVDVPGMLEHLGIRAASRRGSEVWAPCPLPGHDEKEPSWHILDRPGDEKHGWHRCFGCKEGGGAIALVRAVLGLEEGKLAYRWLRERGLVGGRAGALPSTVRLQLSGGPLSPRPPLRPPPGVVFGDLAGWPAPPRRYAASRGVTAAQVDAWGIGWGVDGRLAGRVVIPIRDAAGHLRSYAARAFDDVGGPRYLAPRDSEGPDLSVVFGERFWPPRRERDLVVVGEGALNLLAAQRVADLPVGGFMGSEPAPEHVLKLSTFRRAIFLRDPDQAGARLWDAFVASLGRWLRAVPVDFPPGMDAQAVGDERLAALLRAAV